MVQQYVAAVDATIVGVFSFGSILKPHVRIKCTGLLSLEISRAFLTGLRQENATVCCKDVPDVVFSLRNILPLVTANYELNAALVD